MAYAKITLALCLLALFVSGQAAEWNGGPIDIVDDGTGPNKLVAKFTVKSFKEKDGKVNAKGHLDGTITDAAGKVKKVGQEVHIPVDVSVTPPTDAATDAAGRKMLTLPVPTGCNVLNLLINGVDLNLLGLAVVLQKVQLDIVAVPGANALLGNLLCGVTGLLDGLSLAGIAAFLNNVLNALLSGLSG
jgi:hypothetical protein